MKPSLSREGALEILKANMVEDNVIEHCIAVSRLAGKIARNARENGRSVDVGFVETAALLHDVGRGQTHGIMHGVEGARVMKGFPRYARVCERHVGGGISMHEAAELGLPPKDYLPKTLEERIVCFADKLMDGTRKMCLDEVVRKFQGRLGKDHPTIGRILELDRLLGAFT